MRTYYDPEDDTPRSKADRYELLMELADYLHDERKDREMEDAQDKENREPFPGVE